MQIFDSHAHLFTSRIIANVSAKDGLAARLRLKTQGAKERLGTETLQRSLTENGICGGLVLPTAAAADVARTNAHFIAEVSASPLLKAAGTLHPDDPHTGLEIEKLCRSGVRAVKLCSFSQGFELNGAPALRLFELLQRHNEKCPRPLYVVLDTLYGAHGWFSTHPLHNTTPRQIAVLARHYPAVNFVAAHMGGLAAPFNELRTHLVPCANLYLDTSNAAYTLAAGEFIHLLQTFGSDHILFGTDWPWFTHAAEILLVQRLTTAAGFGAEEKQAVFWSNAARLLGLEAAGSESPRSPAKRQGSLQDEPDGRNTCGR
jgi:predicted TIM-barrel fold metal-dependent hydrolase